MPYTIDIQVSTTGLSDGAFSPLTTLADTGGTFSFDHAPVIAGQLYIYRARRRDTTTNAVSAWSPPAYARAPFPALSGPPQGTNTMIETGLKTKIGVGLEDPASPGVPVQTQILLRRTSGTMDIEKEDSDDATLANIAGEIDSAPGISKVSGSPVCSITPEGLSQLFSAFYGDPVTTVVAALTGPPAVGTYNDHVWTDTTAPGRTVTVNQLKGGKAQCCPGGRVGKFSVSFDKKQNKPLEITPDIMAVNHVDNYTQAELGLDVAGIDPLTVLGATQVTVKVANAVTGTIQKISNDIDKKLAPQDVLDGYRGPVDHNQEDHTQDTGSFEMYFADDSAVQMFYGVTGVTTDKYGMMKATRYTQVSYLIRSIMNANGWCNEIEKVMTRVKFTKVGRPVQGPGAIMVPVSFKAYHDFSTGSTHTWRIRNSQSHASIIAAGTPVAAVPVNDVRPLVLPAP